jgi:hypothetical protein
MLLSDFFKIMLYHNNAITPLKLKHFPQDLRNNFYILIKDLEGFIETKQLTARIFHDVNAKFTTMEKTWLESYLEKREMLIQNSFLQSHLNPANLLCMDLAKALANDHKIESNQFLTSNKPVAKKIKTTFKWHENNFDKINTKNNKIINQNTNFKFSNPDSPNQNHFTVSEKSTKNNKQTRNEMHPLLDGYSPKKRKIDFYSDETQKKTPEQPEFQARINQPVSAGIPIEACIINESSIEIENTNHTENFIRHKNLDDLCAVIDEFIEKEEITFTNELVIEVKNNKESNQFSHAKSLVPNSNLTLRSNKIKSEREIENIYKKAIRELKKIKDRYKMETKEIFFDNSYSFNAEKNALNSLNSIKFLYEEVIAYYFNEDLYDSSLQAVKISLEFMNEYPINEEIFKNELLQLEKCSTVCNAIINNNDPNIIYLKVEAKDLNDSINNYYIPATYCNFAIFSYKSLSNKVLNILKNECIDDADKLINAINNNIDFLTKAQYFFKSSKSNSEFIIINEALSKSYEYIADIQFKVADLKFEQSDVSDVLIILLKQIKDNYHRSFTYLNNGQVGLSILYCQQKLIEIYIDTNKADKGLLEIDNLIQFAKNELSTNKDLSFKLEIISYILYAYSKAFYLTSSKDHQQNALNYLFSNKEFLIKSVTNHLEDFPKEIIKFLINLNIISKNTEWTMQSAIEVAISIPVNLPLIISDNSATLKGSRSGFFQKNNTKMQPASNGEVLQECDKSATYQT